MSRDDRPVGRADAPCRFDEGQVFERKGVAANEPGKRRNAEDRNGDDDVEHSAAEDRDDADRKQDPRKREEHVADAHDHPVPPAFVIPGDQSKSRADERPDGDRHEARGQRDSRAHQDAAEDVAPERVDAEPVLERGQRVQAVVVEEVFRVVRREPGRGQRQHDQQQHERTRDDRDRLTEEFAPELGPRRAHRSRCGDGRNVGFRRLELHVFVHGISDNGSSD